MNPTSNYRPYLNDKIHSIKEKLARQYVKSKSITVAKALEKILNQPNMDNEITEIAVKKLRLSENGELKVREYLSENYLIRHGFK